MPPFDETTVKGHIAAGRIGGLSVDTSIFDKLGRNLNSQPLLGLAQFRHGPTRLLLSEVVVGELKSHLHRFAKDAKQELVGKLKGISTHWHRAVEISAIEAALGVSEEAEAFSQTFFAAFVEAVAPLIIGVEAVEPTELLGLYFGGEPPFGQKEAKKHEFPDALALSSLEAWAISAKTIVLVVSGDAGWKEFATSLNISFAWMSCRSIKHVQRRCWRRSTPCISEA